MDPASAVEAGKGGVEGKREGGIRSDTNSPANRTPTVTSIDPSEKYRVCITCDPRRIPLTCVRMRSLLTMKFSTVVLESILTPLRTSSRLRRATVMAARWVIARA
jgi:hypothetical protein